MAINRRQFGTGMLASGLSVAQAGLARSQSPALTDFLDAGTVAHVLSGDSFTLEDGREVRLAGVEAPRAAQGEASAQPLAQQAKSNLQDLLLDETVRFVDPAPDRFGRLRAHVLSGRNQNWLQGELLSTGMARVRTWNDDQARAQQMLADEQAARTTKTGIWAKAFYAVRDPEAVSAAQGSYQIVEGEVVDASITRKMVYLNFGADWRRDFTAQLDKKTAKLFAATGINLAGLSGAKVRVRGTIRYRNGPMLWLNHPAQMEVLAGS